MASSPFGRLSGLFWHTPTQHDLSQASSAAFAQGAALASRAAASLERTLTHSAGSAPSLLSTPPSHHLSGDPRAALQSARRVILAALYAAMSALVHAWRTLLRAWYWLQAFLLSGAAFSLVAQTYDSTLAAACSLPRTVRTVVWATRAALAYKAFNARFPGHTETDEPFATELADLHVEWAQRLLLVCRTNRGLYVKAGQFASVFGSVPREYRTVLSGLEDRAKARPYGAVRQVLVEELGPCAESLFEQFDRTATAAASLAQVHKARLVGGRQVAVKVQYPGLRSAVQADLWTMKALSRTGRRFFPTFDLHWLFQELEAKLAEELDFRNEVSNAQRLRSILGRLPGVNLPAMYEPLCSARVIVMEWVDGCKITDVPALQALRINPRQVGLKLTSLFAQMTMEHGYIHADPHPGNLMVRTRGNRGMWSWLLHGTHQPFEIVLLDHGTYLTIDNALREQYCALWCAFVVGDTSMAVETATALAGERAGRMLPMLLTHQAKNRGDELRMQKEAGVSGFGDITRILASARRDLVELLRINSVLRNVTAKLGVTMMDRMRLCGASARRGLPPRGSGATLPPRFAAPTFRLRLRVMLGAVNGFCWASGIACRMGQGLLDVFGDGLFGE